MPYTDTSINNLIINQMTQAEYDALETYDQNQIYLITDGGGSSGSLPKIFYGTLDSADVDTQVGFVTCSDFTSSDLANGTIIFVTIATYDLGDMETLSLDLSVNGVGPTSIYRSINTSWTNPYADDFVYGVTYMFTYSSSIHGTGGWIVVGGFDQDTNTTYNIPAVLCQSAASLAAKTSTYASYYALRTGAHFEITMKNSNTKAGALTLNVNSTGAKPIYINGEASSSTNYTLPAGKYIVYYDGTNYHFRTDGHIPGTPNVLSGTATPAAADGLDGDIYIQYSV